jgi:hypothetical protein
VRRALTAAAGGLPVARTAVLAAGAAVLMTVAARVVGPLPALGLLAVGAGAALLVAEPRAAVLAAVAAFVIPEGSELWGVPLATRFYEPIAGPVGPVTLLWMLALVAVLLDAVRRRELALPPASLAVPLTLVAAAFAFGMVNGALGGRADGFALLGAPVSVLPIVVLPLLVVNVLRTPEQVRGAFGVGAALAVGKAALGLVVLQLGLTGWTEGGDPPLTYYEATPNWLTMALLLGVVAAALQRVPMPVWLRWGWPLALACLALSYRRSFWLAALLCVALVVVLATGPTLRRLIVPAVLVLGLGGVLAVRSDVGPTFSGPLAERAASINPSAVRRNEQDRYRLAERRNVVDELRRRPVAGLGFGVGWRGTSPLPFEYDFGRLYVHFAPLWWWLRGGLLGVVAYAWLLVAGAVSGVLVFRRHPDRAVGIGALALGVGLVGYLVADLAGTIAGPDQRGSLLLGTVVGMLAAARRTVPARPGPTGGS